MAHLLHTLLAWVSLGLGGTAVVATGVSASPQPAADEVFEGEASIEPAQRDDDGARFDLDQWQQATFDGTADPDDGVCTTTAALPQPFELEVVLPDGVVDEHAVPVQVLSWAPKTSPPDSARS